MPWNTKSAVRCAGKQPVACGALVALACMALASCGGGPGAAHPDLVVENPAVTDPRPAAGAGFTFSATVRNAGRGNAAATTLRVYRSDNETITPSDEQVGAAAVAGLAASESMVASVTVMAPSRPGTSYYGACVDPVAGESDTANNCSATVRVTVQVPDAVPRADLVVESPDVSAATEAAGARYTFSATVRNAGDGHAAATTLRVYRSDDETITPSDEQVGAAAVPELAASESRVVSVELRVPSSSGTYYYGACVRAVAEESETANNCSAPVPVTVQGPQVAASVPPGPDLVASVWLVGTRSPAIGGIIDLSGKVLNRGRRTTALTTLRFYRSTDATITRSDTQVATRSVRRLGTALNQYLLFLKLPSSKGVYYYGACVDALADESVTTNNCSAAVKVNASQSIPDLWVGSWSVGPRHLRTWTSVGVKVFNSGSPSGATTLRLLLLPSQTSNPSAGTQVGEVGVPELVVTQDESASSLQSVNFQPPTTPGVYYYVMCVDTVTGESDTTNNCTQASIEFL